jgi:hypothetical protein
VVPERQPADLPEITPDAAQRFLADWPFAHAPVEAIVLGTAMCRQPGGVVITSLAGFADLPHWRRPARRLLRAVSSGDASAPGTWAGAASRDGSQSSSSTTEPSAARRAVGPDGR